MNFTEKDLPKALGAVVSGILAFLILNWMGVGGFAKTAAVALIALAFFTDKFGGAGKWLRIAFVVALLVTVFFGWKYTRRTAESFQNRIEEKLPRENFDPKKETERGEPIAIARFYERPDGIIEKVTEEWKRNPFTGEKLAAPGTTEFLEILTRYERQEIERKNQAEHMPGAEPQDLYPCTYYVLGIKALRVEGDVAHPARFTSPQSVEIKGFGSAKGNLSWNDKLTGMYTQTGPRETYEVTMEMTDPNLRVWTGLLGKLGEDGSCKRPGCFRFRITCETGTVVR